MKEIFKNIADYEGLYQVSNLGRVRSIGYGKTKVLKPVTIIGYLHVNLYKDGKGKKFKVHRLVAMAFIPNPNNLPMINHRNEIKTDNRVENLEWCDASYNNSYGTHNQRRAEAQSKPVIQLTLDGRFVREWPSIMKCGRNGFNQGAVSACCRNCYMREGNNIYKGYRWQYKKPTSD